MKVYQIYFDTRLWYGREIEIEGDGDTYMNKGDAANALKEIYQKLCDLYSKDASSCEFSGTDSNYVFCSLWGSLTINNIYGCVRELDVKAETEDSPYKYYVEAKYCFPKANESSETSDPDEVIDLLVGAVNECKNKNLISLKVTRDKKVLIDFFSLQ